MKQLAKAAQVSEGNGAINIRYRLQGPEKVAISVKDNGRGMDKATLEKIFDPFFTTKGVGTGTGLGLSISYGVIQRHGGDILVQSQIGQGTEFTILLPIKPKT